MYFKLVLKQVDFYKKMLGHIKLELIGQNKRSFEIRVSLSIKLIQLIHCSILAFNVHS